MKYYDVFQKAVPQSKREEDQFALVSTFVSRPISIWLSIPLLKTSIKATTITKVSVVSLFIGFFILAFSKCLSMSLFGWFFFFIWAILDHVDGNIARYKNECSLMGDLWDTMGGYLAMCLMYFAAGLIAYSETPLIDFIQSHIYIALGGATSLLSIFPRLMMHKKKSSMPQSDFGKEYTDKKNFSIPKIIIMNIVAPTDGLLLFFLISLLYDICYAYVLFYFLINCIVTLVAIKGILRE